MSHRAKTNLVFVGTFAYLALLGTFPGPVLIISVVVFFYLALDMIIA